MLQDDHSQPDRLPPHYGGPVSGEQFWPRPDIVDNLVETLRSGVSVTLFGLRRIGKSSAMAEAARRLQADGNCTIVSIDAQDFNGLEKLLTELLAALPSDGTLMTTILQKLGGNRFFPAALKTGLEVMLGKKPSEEDGLARYVADYWGPICNEISSAIKESGTRFILMIDEFPFMCQGMLAQKKGRELVDKLLATLRQWRAGPITMVLSGSIGMRFLAREHNLEFVHLNDFVPLEITPLASQGEARAMITAMVRAADLTWWTDETTEAMLDETAAYYPSFLQFAFNQLRVRRAATQEAIAEIFAEHIRPNLDVTFFDQFDGRIKRYDEPLRKGAAAILGGIVAADPGLVQRTKLVETLGADEAQGDLSETLKLLKEDGFLGQRVERDGSESWRLASPLVKAWWLQRRGQGAS